MIVILLLLRFTESFIVFVFDINKHGEIIDIIILLNNSKSASCIRCYQSRPMRAALVPPSSPSPTDPVNIHKQTHDAHTINKVCIKNQGKINHHKSTNYES